jgi:iron-only hydrogenase group A
MKTVIINGKTTQVEDGSTILEAAQQAGEKIPTLCYLKGLFPSGACRMCVVEVKGTPNLVPSCSQPVAEGMELFTRSPRVINARRTIIELLLASHPFDCLTCTRSGSCELQALAEEYQIERVSFRGATRHHFKDLSSPSIVRDPDKCILCGRCVRICEEIQGVSAVDFTKRGFATMVLPAFENDLSGTTCTGCGQCVIACPTGALSEYPAVSSVLDTLQEGKKQMVAQVAPAIRVSLGEFFGLDPGRNVTGLIVSALRKMGFGTVFDTDFTADLTIIEEAHELIGRIRGGGKLPLFTSCCPAWIKYAEQHYPQLLPHLSTCKSPQQMMGSIVKRHLAKSRGWNPEDVYVVSIMPCTAKKYERGRPEMGGNGHADVDAVLTTRELAKLIRIHGIDFHKLREEDFSSPFDVSSGTGDIFAASGGVMESALRTAHFLLTGKDLRNIEFEQVRGYAGLKEAEVALGDLTLTVAVCNTIANANHLLQRILSGEKTYHFVEVMACAGGCAGGGGQIYGYDPEKTKSRMEALYRLDAIRSVRLSYNNPAIKRIYEEELEAPGSKRAHELLHTAYKPMSKRT